MQKLTYQDFYDDMGLVAEPLIANSLWLWAQKAWIGMGNRPHGDNLAVGWREGVKPGGAGGPSNPNYVALTTTPWTDITSWFGALPATANTCTNAAVKVWDIQCQWFDLTTQSWKLIDPLAYIYRSAAGGTVKWWTTDTFTSLGFADNLYTSRANIPSFCTTRLLANRGAANPDNAIQNIIHNGMARATGMDYTKIGGIATMCKAKIEPLPGDAVLNGDPRIYLQVGADYWPRPNIKADELGSVLEGITNIPAVGAGKLKKLTTAEQAFLFVTANINPATYKETTSNYINSFPAGTYPNCMTDAVFRANVPQFLTF